MHAQYIHSEMPHVILDAQSKTTYLVMSLGPVLFAKYIWILYTCIDIVYLCSFKLHVLKHEPPRSAIASQGHPIDLVPKWQPPRPTGLTGAELHPVARVAKTGSCYVWNWNCLNIKQLFKTGISGWKETLWVHCTLLLSLCSTVWVMKILAGSFDVDQTFGKLQGSSLDSSGFGLRFLCPGRSKSPTGGRLPGWTRGGLPKEWCFASYCGVTLEHDMYEVGADNF